MKIFSIIPIILLLFTTQIQAQLPHGSSAPDFSVSDINGGSFNLYSQTSQGKGVIIDLFATWCGPCWSFHNSGVINQVLNNLGAFSSAISLEADSRTNTGCILNSGCNYSTIGNWATVPYQIANLTASNGGNVKSGYALSYYPTVYVISHDNRAYEIRNKTYGVFRSWLQESFFLTANPVVGKANCGGDGFIRLNRTKGYGSISYNWSNGESTEDIQNLNAGTYSVTVEDQNGYDKVFGPFVVTGPSQPLSVETILEQDVSCFSGDDGSIEILGVGGNHGYQYVWSDGQTGSIATGLTQGLYRVTVTDSKGCQTFDQYFVDQPSALGVNSNLIATTCGESNGEIYVTANGGTPPYKYDIGGGEKTDPVFKNLAAGKYVIQVRDLKDCISHQNIELGSIDGPEAHAGVDAELDCSTPTLIIQGSGSAGPDIEYLWITLDGLIKGDSTNLEVEVQEPGTYVLSVLDVMLDCSSYDTVIISDGRSYPEYEFEAYDNLNCVDVTSWLTCDTVDHATYLWTTVNGNIVGKDDSLATEVDAPGWYYLSVQDTNSSCVTLDSLEVLEDVITPDFNISGPNEQGCPEDVLALIIMDLDSLRQYSYEWSTSDGNFIGNTDELEVNVNVAGTYTATVLDLENGCENILDFSVVNDWNVAKAVYQVSKSALDVSFTDQSEGDNLSYEWTFGDGSTSQDPSPIHTYSSEGTFEVCLTVENECGDDQSCEEIEVSENRGPLQVADVEILHVDCFGNETGKIRLNISGGYSPYTVNWSNGKTGLSINALTAGDYEATILDNKSNQIMKSYTIVEPDALIASDIIVSKDNGQDSGEIYLSVKGGTGAYSYLWSDGSIDNPAAGLMSGDYSCIVTDENGCELAVGPITVELSTGIKSIDVSLISIFPNPASVELCLEIEANEILETETVNVLGERVVLDWNGQTCVNIETILPGIYWTTIQTKDGYRMAKWVKAQR